MITVYDVVQEGEGPEDARDVEEFDIENPEDKIYEMIRRRGLVNFFFMNHFLYLIG